MEALPQSLDDGRYQLHEPLGQGGMAVVYRCWDNSLGVWRAAKFLLPALAKSQRARQRFAAEAHAMARVDHPNVIRVFDVGEVAGHPYMVTEFAPGGSLENWMERHGRMPPRMAVEVARQIARGVGAAHDEGIIHRDVKPDNVLVCKKGTCKVTDFGIAQLADLSSFTRTGSAMGTLAYMAPEQRRDAKNIDKTVDIYAMGATLWSLLTGEVPTDLFMTSHDPSLLGPVPDALAPALLRALSFDPSARFPDAASWIAALDEAFPGLPVTPAATPSLVTRDVTPLLTAPSAPSFLSQGDHAERSEASLPTLLPTDDSPRAESSRPPAAGAGPSKALPYFMPAAIPRERGGEPSYLEEVDEAAERRKREALQKIQEIQRKRRQATPVPTRPSARTPVPVLASRADPAPDARVVGPSGATPEAKQRTATPAVHVVRASSDTAKEVQEAGLEFFIATMKFVLNPLKAMVIPVVGLFVILSIYLGVAASHVRGVAREARSATSGLIAEIESEARIIDDLKEIGAQWQLPDAHLLRLRAVPEAERVPVAMQYIKTLHEQNERFLYSAPAHAAHRAQMAQDRIKKLDAAVKRYQQAMLAWEQAADETRGRSVCSLGLAPCP